MIKTRQDGTELTVYLHGEIDHCIAQIIRDEIETILRKSRIMHLILDFSQVSFMDSSGVGMIIGRYKTVSSYGGVVSAVGLHPPVSRLFHIAGLHRILKTHENQKEMKTNDD